MNLILYAVLVAVFALSVAGFVGLAIAIIADDWK